MRKKAPSLLDLPCNVTVLAVDTARISGWAIRCAHKLKYSGEVDTYDYEALERICTLTESISRTVQTPHRPVLVLEKPWGGRLGVVVALGMARERWRVAWELVGLRHKRIVSVMPAQWRAAVLGHGAHKLPRDEVRERERLSAQAEVRAGIELGPDESAAILISTWAVRAPAVGALCGLKGGQHV